MDRASKNDMSIRIASVVAFLHRNGDREMWGNRALIFGALVAVTGCAQLEQANIAKSAQSQMVGISKEDVLSCMGPPHRRMAEGQTEVWAYDASSGSTLSADPVLGSQSIDRLYCTINVVMASGRVSRLDYAGRTTGSDFGVASGAQCAVAVHKCVR